MHNDTTRRFSRSLKESFGPYADYLTSDEGHSRADKLIVTISGIGLWVIVVGLLLEVI